MERGGTLTYLSALYMYIIGHCSAVVQCNAAQCRIEKYCTVQCSVEEHTHSREGFGPFSPTHVFKGFVGGANGKLEILKKHFDSAILKT